MVKYVKRPNLIPLKAAFIQKVVLMYLSFPQTDKPYHFPELEFWICDILKGSNNVKSAPELALKAQIAKWSLICAFRATSDSYVTWFEPFKIAQFQNSSLGKQ